MINSMPADITCSQLFSAQESRNGGLLARQLIAVSQSPQRIAPQPPAAPRSFAARIARKNRLTARVYAKRKNETLEQWAFRLSILLPALSLHIILALTGADATQLQRQLDFNTLFLSEVGREIQSILESDHPGDFQRKPFEPARVWATRLKELRPMLSRNEASLFTGASVSSLRNIKAFNHEPLSAAGVEVQAFLNSAEGREYARGADNNDVQRAVKLKQRFKQLPVRDAALLTGANPGSLANCAVFRNHKLSAIGNKILHSLHHDPCSEYTAKINNNPLRWALQLKELEPQLTRNDAIAITQVNASSLKNRPEFLTRGLSDAGRKIRAILDSPWPGIYRRSEHELPLDWAVRLRQRVPLLTLEDCMILTGCNASSLRGRMTFYTPRLSPAGRMLQVKLAGANPGIYRRDDHESPGEWGTRLIRLIRGLKHKDVAILLQQEALSARYHSATASEPEEITDIINREIDRYQQGAATPAAVRELFSRAPSPAISEILAAETVRYQLGAATPQVVRELFSNVASPATSWISDQENESHNIATPLSPLVVAESAWATAQTVDSQLMQQVMLTQGLISVPNNADTGTQFRNCLLIALLQHATGDYSQSDAINAQVNYYRQRLIELGWLCHNSGFEEDGYMAFGHENDATQGAAAAVIELLNQDLIRMNLSPLAVINHSFAGDREYLDVLGSQAACARKVHILNSGQHFEALVPINFTDGGKDYYHAAESINAHNINSLPSARC
ncbi:hypothetical protein [Pantoea sp. B65]|uniref:hypothetical protein n=1 Tax=Pantoea sp. B65 TaxID=2813359 RepID=UPI0039B52113